MPQNELGKGSCKDGSEITTDQVCDTSSKKCKNCEKGVTQPDQKIKMYYNSKYDLPFSFNTYFLFALHTWSAYF